VNDKEATKHKFYYGEETYTICVTKDDWWLEDGPADMSNRMMDAGEEFALENGMLPSAAVCVECRIGDYVDIVEDYHIGGTTIKDLDLHRCYKCGHTTLPWTSVERVDKALEAAKKPAELCPTCHKSNTVEVTGDVKMDTVCRLNGEPFTVPNITRTQCPACKDEFFFMSECEKIGAAIQAEQKRRGLE
jgi:uncharacterized CHY-type Zn-finger protein